MRKAVVCLALTGFLVASIGMMGCAQKPKSETGQQAIEASKSLATVQEKAQYLVQEAKAFYDSKKFQDAVTSAQYVLSYLDKNSQGAQSLLEKAKAELEAKVKGAVADAQKNLGSFGTK